MNQIYWTLKYARRALYLMAAMSMIFGMPAISQSRTVRENNHSMVQAKSRGASGNLPETQKLMNNNRLFPGQNRTQAMRIEAETGHLTPEEDAVLKHKRPKVVSPAQARAVRAAHSHSHATIKPMIKNYK
jgi:hypothetical protein